MLRDTTYSMFRRHINALSSKPLQKVFVLKLSIWEWGSLFLSNEKTEKGLRVVSTRCMRSNTLFFSFSTPWMAPLTRSWRTNEQGNSSRKFAWNLVNLKCHDSFIPCVLKPCPLECKSETLSVGMMLWTGRINDDLRRCQRAHHYFTKNIKLWSHRWKQIVIFEWTWRNKQRVLGKSCRRTSPSSQGNPEVGRKESILRGTISGELLLCNTA